MKSRPVVIGTIVVVSVVGVAVPFIASHWPSIRQTAAPVVVGRETAAP